MDTIAIIANAQELERDIELLFLITYGSIEYEDKLSSHLMLERKTKRHVRESEGTPPGQSATPAK